ncbi:hypothetical protein UA08_04135 [Talaromyces atroroseus]|uniref:J domain-containing protein n=1 Tax=Talaromyces atroroseus TaxID=1441469 RepID=A0A1Q5Q8F6_TALAT|nr:hypothetical protein UA08_04135 [Talaromyces atroroseus]OKL60309.1 hypothetical protein UA08_04135 [Talaromyces atroroseus]
MSRNLPDFDPYAVLGVDKNASPSEIKTAYRKLILKCHPDKIQDPSLRSKAVDDFQKVQESYEILGDDARRQLHDQEVRLADLRSQLKAQKASADSYSSSRGTSSREFRDGRMYEERVPADAFFTDSDEARYAEEPLTYSHKYSDSAKRPHTKATEEKKKSKTTPTTTSSPRFSKQSDREYTRATHHDRAKVRTKERRRDVSDKYERKNAAYVISDAEDVSGSDVEPAHYRTRVEPESRYSTRDSRRSKTDSVPSYASRRRRYDSESETDDEGDYDAASELKFDTQENFAKEYISRKKDPVIQVDRKPRSSRHTGYDDRDRHYSERSERDSTRYSSRSYSRTDNVHVTESSATHASRRSHERLSSPSRGYERERPVPTMSSSTSSSQRVSSSRAPPPPVSRSATAPYPRTTRREGSSRSESNVLPTLVNMVSGLKGDTILHSRPRPRAAERNDSGYSSGPGTPEMAQGPSSASRINRYKVVEPHEERETVIVEPIEPRYRDSPPPTPRSERERERSSMSSRTSKPTRTYTYEHEPEVRTVRPAAVSSKSTSSTRPLYREIRQSPEIVFEGRRYRQPAY